MKFITISQLIIIDILRGVYRNIELIIILEKRKTGMLLVLTYQQKIFPENVVFF